MFPLLVQCSYCSWCRHYSIIFMVNRLTDEVRIFDVVSKRDCVVYYASTPVLCSLSNLLEFLRLLFARALHQPRTHKSTAADQICKARCFQSCRKCSAKLSEPPCHQSYQVTSLCFVLRHKTAAPQNTTVSTSRALFNFSLAGRMMFLARSTNDAVFVDNIIRWREGWTFTSLV